MQIKIVPAYDGDYFFMEKRDCLLYLSGKQDKIKEHTFLSFAKKANVNLFLHKEGEKLCRNCYMV